MVTAMGLTSGASFLSGTAALAGVFPKTGVAGTLAWAVAADGQRIRYETFGDSGLALVFVHGGMCDRTYWAAQITAFAPDYRVITLDLPGHGDSDKSRTQWSIEGFGDDVARTVRAAGVERAILIGHSLGGQVVLEAARQLGSSSVGVVIVDFLHQPGVKPPKAPQLEPEAFKSAMRKGMFTQASDPALANRIVEAMTSASPQIAMGIRSASESHDAPAALRAIATTPIVMILSTLRPVAVDVIRALHPGAYIFVVPGVGHFVMIEAPVAFNTLLRAEAMIMAGKVRAL